MPDYREQTARPSTGIIGTPALGVRQDTAADISNANLDLAMPQFNSAGSLRVTCEGGLATYRAVVANVAPLAGNTLTIAGSATKTIKVKKVRVTGGVATAVGYVDATLNKQSAADTGGTAGTAPTAVPLDSGNAAATAALVLYTAAPTAGTVVGAVGQDKLTLASTTAVAGEVGGSATLFGDDGRNVTGEQELVLRGTSQLAAVKFGSAPAGGSVNIIVEWTEEPTTA